MNENAVKQATGRPSSSTDTNLSDQLIRALKIIQKESCYRMLTKTAKDRVSTKQMTRYTPERYLTAPL